jgi:hypothetical protein
MDVIFRSFIFFFVDISKYKDFFSRNSVFSKSILYIIDLFFIFQLFYSLTEIKLKFIRTSPNKELLMKVLAI